MVDYANANHRSPTVSYIQSDMGQPNIARCKNLYGKFSKIFSFSCAHWMKDKFVFFKNLQDLLQDNGEAFLIFMIYKSPFYDSLMTVAKSQEWRKYHSIEVWHCSQEKSHSKIQVLYKLIFTFQKLDATFDSLWRNPEAIKGLRAQLESTDLEMLHFEPRIQEHIFNDAEDVKGHINAVSPALKTIPDELKDKYLNDRVKATELEWLDNGKIKKR